MTKNLLAYLDESRFLWWLILSAVVISIFGPALVNDNLRPAGTIVTDLREVYLPLEYYTRSAFESGYLPHWNPYIFSGMPGLAHPQTLLFYPPTAILRLLLPINLSITWGLALHIYIAGIGMYLLMKQFHLPSWISLLSAIMYMISGEIVTRIYAGHVWLIYSLCLLPLTWLTFIKMLTGSEIRYMIYSSFLIGLIILTGHPTNIAYIIILLTLYFIYHLVTTWDRNDVKSTYQTGIRFLIAMILGSLISAVQLIPTLRYYASGTNLNSGYDMASLLERAPQIADLSIAILPPINAMVQGDPWVCEVLPYIGLLPLICTPLSLAHKTHRHLARAIFIVAICFLLMSFGGYGMKILYTYIPPMRILRFPGRLLSFWPLLMIVLSAFGMDNLINADHQNNNTFNLIYFIGHLIIALVYSCIISLFIVNNVKFWSPSPTFWVFSIPISICGFVLFYRLALVRKISIRKPVFLVVYFSMYVFGILSGISISTSSIQNIPIRTIQLIIFIVFLELLLFLLNTLQHKSHRNSIAALLIILITFLDLYQAGYHYFQPEISNDISENAVQLTNHLPSPDKGRILQAIPQYPMRRNENIIHNIASVAGYNSGNLSYYTEYIRAVAHGFPTDPTMLLISQTQLDQQTYDFLNVTHLVTNDIPVNKQWGELTTIGDVQIYENPSALDRVFWVPHTAYIPNPQDVLASLTNPAFDYTETVIVETPVEVESTNSQPDIEIECVEYIPYSGRLGIKTNTSHEGMLVSSEPYYPERHAYIDGVEVPLHRANFAFVAIKLPAGEHYVEIDYVPTAFRIGLAITVASLICCAIILLRQRS